MAWVITSSMTDARCVGFNVDFEGETLGLARALLHACPAGTRTTRLPSFSGDRSRCVGLETYRDVGIARSRACAFITDAISACTNRLTPLVLAVGPAGPRQQTLERAAYVGRWSLSGRTSARGVCGGGSERGERKQKGKGKGA